VLITANEGWEEQPSPWLPSSWPFLLVRDAKSDTFSVEKLNRQLRGKELRRDIWGANTKFGVIGTETRM
jgi:hypothetical protein